MNSKDFNSGMASGKISLGVFALDQLPWLFKCNSLVAIKILFSFIELADIRSGEVYLSHGVRTWLKNRLGISTASLYAALRFLEESGAIEKISYPDKETGLPIRSGSDFRINLMMFRRRLEGERRWKNKTR